MKFIYPDEMKVPYVNLGAQITDDIDSLMDDLRSILLSGQYILGPEVEKFEIEIADFLSARFAVGVANGTDALVLAMKSLGIGPGDEVITAPNSYLASASSILMVGAKPVFADVGSDYNINPEEIEKCINDRTKAIIPVHLTGNPAPMESILNLAKKYSLKVVEDAAQAIGAKRNGSYVGGIGDVGCFSLHPLKNLGAAGDAGLIVTNDEKIYNYLLKARNHGLRNRDECEFYSLNSRLDPIQAAILRLKLKNLNAWNDRRREIASMYIQHLAEYLMIPEIQEEDEAVFHAFVVLANEREQLQESLASKGIETKIHYPVPIHEQEAFKSYVKEGQSFPNVDDQKSKILSLPVYPELTNEQVKYVIDTIIEFYR